MMGVVEFTYGNGVRLGSEPYGTTPDEYRRMAKDLTYFAHRDGTFNCNGLSPDDIERGTNYTVHFDEKTRNAFR